MNVVVFSGTTEGRSFSRALAALGAAVTVCVATELGAEEQGRADDNEETIRKRFEVYHNQTAPLAEWFEKEGMRHTFRWADHPSKEEMIGSIFAFLDQLN